MIKYGEVKATEWDHDNPGNLPWLTAHPDPHPKRRESGELPTSARRIRTFILDIGSFQGGINWSATKSFVVHLAEGVRGDPKSLTEFTTLKAKGLLASGTAVIHGAAFGEREFQKMGAAGARLIWSPRSNLVLYAQTTDIPLAGQKGMRARSRWAWTGIQAAAITSLTSCGRLLRSTKRTSTEPSLTPEWITMITVNAAKALALDAFIGRLAPELKADITVLRARDDDPTKSVMKTHLQDVQMVWVGGDLLYANKAILDKMKPGECEAMLVYGSQKKVCVKNTPKAAQTLEDIRAMLHTNYPLLAPLTP